MSDLRTVYSFWPRLNERLATVAANLTAEQLMLKPSPDQWPVWATIGHLACQRVFWFCDFAGEPGADTTPFTNAAYNCPGDDDLGHVLGAEQLASALRSSFAIIQRALDTWTLESLSETIRRPEFGPDWHMRRGVLLERTLAHDAWHAGQASQTLSAHGVARIDIWE